MEKSSLAKWDSAIRDKRQEFLTTFLESQVRENSEWIGTKIEDGEPEQFARFETLLWGGDELMFVMPAALGWRFASLFFDHFKEWTFEDQPLTHSAALVFVHHHSPIHRLKRLAKDQMTEFAKEKHQKRNQLVYTVLESFDHLGTSFEDAMAKRYGSPGIVEKMLLPTDGDLLKTMSEQFEVLRHPENDFARSQLRSLVQTLIKGDQVVTVDAALKSHFFRAKPEAITALTTLKDILPPNALWLHLEELWDYALP
jgi:hypothetical protein